MTQPDSPHPAAAAGRQPMQVSETLVFEDSIRALHGPMRASGLSVVAVAGLLCIVLSQYYAWWELALWLAGVLLTQSGVLHLLVFNRPAAHNLKQWGRYYFFNGLVTGLYWGGSLLYFVDPAHPEIQFFIALALGGSAAGSIAVQAFYPRMMVGYLLCLILPFSLRTLAMGDLLHSYLGAGMLLLTVYLLYFGHFHARTLRRAIILRHENAGLVEELREKALALEQASHAKSQFFAAASHDLRQPLHALSFYTSLLRPHTRDAPHVERIEQCVGSLDDLLEGLLDISRLDAGRIKPDMGPVPVHELLQRLASLYAGAAAAKGIHLRVHAQPAWGASDAALLERVLANLLSNALRYTYSGTVLLTARPLGGQLRVQVIDTGVGIPAEAQDRIFEEFVQLNNPQRDPSQGVGLGLATVRRLCTLLDHPLALRSQPGRGSRFEVRLALAATPPMAEAPTIPPSASAHQLRGRVLVVDDHELVRESLVQTLGTWGLSCDSAIDGAEALALVNRQKYDAVLCDWRLPGDFDGTRVLAAIRMLQPQIAFTALVTGETEASLGEVADGVVVVRKPIRPIRLRALLSAYLGA